MGTRRKDNCNRRAIWIEHAGAVFVGFVSMTLLVFACRALVANAAQTGYDESASSCMAPVIAQIFDEDTFVWRDCAGTWHVRGRNRQNTTHRIVGRVASSAPVLTYHPYSGRADAHISTTGNGELLMDLPIEGALSGFDFTVTSGADLCVDISTSGASGVLRVGEYGVPVASAVNPASLLPCVPGGSPALVAPIDQTTLGGSTQPFVFDSGPTQVAQWRIDIGSSAGADDYFISPPITNESTIIVTGLPVDGSVVHATLYYETVNGNTESLAYSYIAANGIEFTESNLPPVLVTPPLQLHTEAQAVSVPVEASDPEGQPLANWIASGLPPGLSLSPGGVISGTLAVPGSAGSYSVTVSVDDGMPEHQQSITFPWQVEPAAVPTYIPPSGPLPTDPYLWEVTEGTNARATIDLGLRVRRGYDYSELFGFNLNWYAFQAQVWDNTTQTLRDPSMINNLANYLPGVRQRFPGGNNSVSWVWDQTRGAVATRSPWESFYSGVLTTPHFGIDEFIDYAVAINAKRFFHVMNLTGLYPQDIDQLATKEALAQNNLGLAAHLNQALPASYPHWQLGNELERARIGFSHQELADRAKASIDSIRIVQPDARFVAHLREHDYQGATWESFMQDMYGALPRVHDHGLFAYYDPSQDPGFIPTVHHIYWMPWYLAKLQQNIDYFEDTVRPGQTARIWIVEHARRRLSVDWDNPPLDANGNPYDPTPWLVSNLGGSIATADYLVALMQVPQVMGAMYHGSPGGPWRIFDNGLYDGDFDPLTIFWTYALLSENTLTDVVATANESDNAAGYIGGYDTRAVAFFDTACQIKVWVVNRQRNDLAFDIVIPAWANQPVAIKHAGIYGAIGQDPDATGYEGVVSLTPQSLPAATLSAAGSTTVLLPPSSINVYTLDCN